MVTNGNHIMYKGCRREKQIKQFDLYGEHIILKIGLDSDEGVMKIGGRMLNNYVQEKIGRT